jgi:Nif-specific regulatory protein
VIDALERNNLNQSAAARELGITLRQMGYRVKKFGLEEMLKPRRSAQ